MRLFKKYIEHFVLIKLTGVMKKTADFPILIILK